MKTPDHRLEFVVALTTPDAEPAALSQLSASVSLACSRDHATHAER
jgi:hypothetical protein